MISGQSAMTVPIRTAGMGLMTDTYEPTPEDIEILNLIDMGYIGYKKPEVVYIVEEFYLEEPDFDTRFDIDQE